MAGACPWTNGERPDDKIARTTSADLRIPWPGWIFKSIVPSKREVIEIPLGKDKAFLPPELDKVRVDGKPHKAIGPALTPRIVRSSDELAKGQGLLLVIGLHDLKYRP